LRGFIRKWHDLGYPGVTDDVVQLLSGWRLQGNEKGLAVSLMDPEEGPLSDIEMAACLDGLLAGYMQGKVSLEDYALSSTLAHSGRRAVQIVSLKLKDLVKEKQGGVWQYSINFPRAKQRGAGWREEFNSYAIVEDLWLLLELQVESVIKFAQGICDGEIPDSTLKELPLFPNRESFQQGIKASLLQEQLYFDIHHATRDSCNSALKRCVKAVKIRSERTGELLKITSKRFRYTLGSNLAREGRGEYIIAELLDHSDTQNAGVYVRNVPDIVERIDKAVAMQLAPLAQAFQGIMVKSEGEAIRGDDKASRVGNGRVDVGSCGSYGFCGALAPIACYTCAHFQPWLDGPHEEVLDELIAKRDDVLATTNDSKVAAVNDRLILAVGDVILRCKKARNEVRVLEVSNG
jgi:integrase